MRSELKMRNRILSVIAAATCLGLTAAADTIPEKLSRPVEWRVGAEASSAGVLITNSFLRGDNSLGKKISSTFGGVLRADFSFNPATREGTLYPGLYQGVGLGMSGYSPNGLLGTPVSAYVYQGAPIYHFSDRLSLGYEWQFGAAFGWMHYNKETAEDNVAIGSPVTAHMGIFFKFNYRLSDRWGIFFGVGANHYSNGNTSYPNRGVNTVGALIGFAYVLNPQRAPKEAANTIAYGAEGKRWIYDIMAFGAWRKRGLVVGYLEEGVMCPGKFGVLGLQFSPSYRINRYFAAGPSLDFQWDESGGLRPYWVEGAYEEDIKFRRPSFGKQISLGLSAHAELIMPIFSVNIGLGYDFVNPKGDKAFYQSLTLKTFITKNVYINTGYRIGDFKDPQNLMLGIGVRL
ncbi:MAG: acyloxyacyl hydrolase [Muribaculaceae bacterium]|nr:acyloxyacyl hydrolase [Muribaculaceae bacterium]